MLMPMDRMIEKAEKLLKRGSVEQMDFDRYNVVGDHGTYTVVRTIDGKVVCNCPGFRGKGRCSHATAVIILTTKFPLSET
jgi:hypothetical protein